MGNFSENIFLDLKNMLIKFYNKFNNFQSAPNLFYFSLKLLGRLEQCMEGYRTRIAEREDKDIVANYLSCRPDTGQTLRSPRLRLGTLINFD